MVKNSVFKGLFRFNFSSKSQEDEFFEDMIGYSDIYGHDEGYYSTYDWVGNNGYQNIDRWMETAAQQAGK